MPTVRMSLTFQDVEGSKKTIPLYFDSADITTLAIAQTVYTIYETALHAVTGAAIVNAEVCFGLNLSNAETPDAGYSVYNGAYMSFDDSDDVGQGIYVPAMLQGKMANELVIPTDTQVAALIDLILNGTGGAEPLSSRGSAALWTAYKIGRQVVRKVTR